MSLFFPKIHDQRTAKKAVKYAAAAAFFIAGASGAVAAASLLLNHPIMGFDERGFRDAVVFAVVGWGILKTSRIAAGFGLSFWLFEAAQRYIARPGSAPTGALILTIFLILYLLHGARGTWFIQRLAADERRTEAAALNASLFSLQDLGT